MYPCYKSFDEFVDLEKLKSLDAYLVAKIHNHIANQREQYFLNAYRLDTKTPQKPGAREIWLTTPNLTKATPGADIYDELDRSELWDLSADSEQFPLLLEFIQTLPFETTGRMLIIYDDLATAVPAHRDHLDTNVCQEFIWFRTNLRKPFFMLNHLNTQKQYVESYTAWFDSVNQFHGTEAVQGLSFSIRVDGRFTDEFRKQIPFAAENLASTPALWATKTQRTSANQSNAVSRRLA